MHSESPRLRDADALDVTLSRSADLLPMCGAAMPLHEGKTASGQVEMLQLYHRISVLPEGIRTAVNGPVISTTHRPAQPPLTGMSLSYIRVHIPKSPAHEGANSGSDQAISLQIARTLQAVRQPAVVDLARRSDQSRRCRAGSSKGLC